MLTRRNILALLGVGTALLRTGTPACAETELAFGDLYDGEAVLARKCLDLSGEEVVMTGYMAPPLKAEAKFFVLTSMPMATCPFCETEAQWPDDIVVVFTAEPMSAVAFNRPIAVRGILETGFAKDPETGFVSLIRLVDADFDKV